MTVPGGRPLNIRAILQQVAAKQQYTRPMRIAVAITVVGQAGPMEGEAGTVVGQAGIPATHVRPMWSSGR